MIRRKRSVDDVDTVTFNMQSRQKVVYTSQFYWELVPDSTLTIFNTWKTV